MTLLFCDSFSHYDSTEYLRKYPSGGSIGSVHPSAGRWSGYQGAFLSSVGQYLGFPVSNLATTIQGVGYYISTWPSGDTGGCIFGLADGATENLRITLDSTGKLRAYRGISNLLGTSTKALSLNTWYFLELKCTVNSTTGSVEVRVNGTSTGWLNLTNQNTQGGSNAYSSSVWLGKPGSASANGTGAHTRYFADYYVADTNGTANNDFLGDIRVYCLFPDGNGNSSQWVGSDSNSTDNYLLVDDETVVDDDTTYVQSATSGNKDTYSFDDLPSNTGTIYGVAVTPLVRKTDAGNRSITPVIRSNGVDYDQTNVAVADNYLYYQEIIEQDPDTSAAWDEAGVNAAEFGLKVG